MSTSPPSPPRPPTGSHPAIDGRWDEWARLVLWRLEQLEHLEREATRSREMTTRTLAVLQVKVTLYSAGVAMLVSALAEVAVKLIGK